MDNPLLIHDYYPAFFIRKWFEALSPFSSFVEVKYDNEYNVMERTMPTASGLWRLTAALLYGYTVQHLIFHLLGLCKGDLPLHTTKGRFDYLDCMIIAVKINDSVRVLNQTSCNISWLMYILFS